MFDPTCNDPAKIESFVSKALTPRSVSLITSGIGRGKTSVLKMVASKALEAELPVYANGYVDEFSALIGKENSTEFAGLTSEERASQLRALADLPEFGVVLIDGGRIGDALVHGGMAQALHDIAQRHAVVVADHLQSSAELEAIGLTPSNELKIN